MPGSRTKDDSTQEREARCPRSPAGFFREEGCIGGQDHALARSELMAPPHDADKVRVADVRRPDFDVRRHLLPAGHLLDGPGVYRIEDVAASVAMTLCDRGSRIDKGCEVGS